MLKKISHVTWKYCMMRQLQLFVVLDLMTSSFCSNHNDAGELWLEDYTRKRVVGDDIQSDSPRGLSDEETPEYTCPTFPEETPPASALYCLLPACDTDIDCDWPVQKCCHNGCLYSCTEGIPPPPFIDWRREPERDPRTGISWLIKDEPVDNEVENEENEEEKIREEMARSHFAEQCEIDNTIYKDGSTFIHNTYLCNCHKGLVDCDVRKR